MKKNPHHQTSRGFTLVELLIVFTVIAILVGLFSAVATHIKAKALAAQEIAAAKNLTTGLHLYAADHRGRLLPGVDRSVATVETPGGQVGGEPAYRYPWRLAPYVGNTAKGNYVLDINKEDMARPNPDDPKNVYHVSLMPALGYNGYILGGYIHSSGAGSGASHFFERQDLVRRANSADAMPLIAFASAFSKRFSGDDGRKGNHLITAPRMTAPGVQAWAGNDWSNDALSTQFGNVDLRHNGQAVVARLDGSIQMMGLEELKDMRNWSPVALEEDDPQYTLNYR